MLWLTLAIFIALSAEACVHPGHGPVALAVPLVTWTIPIDTRDDTRFCVETALMAWVDPADVLPLRCVSVGAIRGWIRAQRLAN